MDIVDRTTRSRMMRSVKQRDTRPEMSLRSALFSSGLRYRLHSRALPGTPDLVFHARKCAIFVHGCYWHRHTCKYATVPKSNVEFWTAKFSANKRRDTNSVRALEEMGWRTLVIWECTLRSDEGLQKAVSRVHDWLNGA